MTRASIYPGKVRNGFHVVPLLALTACLSACATGPASSGSTGYVLLPADRATVNALPRPNFSAVDLSGGCRDNSFAFANEAAKSAWPAPSYFRPLNDWAMSYAGSRVATSSPKCLDGERVVKLWQSAIGTPITGRLSERDVSEFVGAIDRVDPRYANAAAVRQMTPQEREVDLYYSAAQRGDPKAQYRLATVYEKQGNLAEAKTWYGKSAEQGFPLALKKLGRNPARVPSNLSRNEIAQYYRAAPDTPTQGGNGATAFAMSQEMERTRGLQQLQETQAQEQARIAEQNARNIEQQNQWARENQARIQAEEQQWRQMQQAAP